MVRKMGSPALDAFLATAADLRASDLHIIAGVPPAFRVNGDIIFADHDALSATDAIEICYSILSDEQRVMADMARHGFVDIGRRSLGVQ